MDVKTARKLAAKTKQPKPTDDFLAFDLNDGKVGYIDKCDEKILYQHHWRAHKKRNKYYISARVDDNTFLSMHRMLLKAPPRMLVDHINGDGLDNRRCNIRLCTHLQNVRNVSKQKIKNPSSKFKGVKREGSKYSAKITVYKKRIYLGVYSDEHDAALAYDLAALKFYKEFAYTNFPKSILDKISWRPAALAAWKSSLPAGGEKCGK